MSSRRLVLAGGSGFLGQALSRYFAALGWEVVVLTRAPRHVGNSVRTVRWDGERLGGWTRELDGAAVVINLAGRSVNCRYHPRNRRVIMESRLLPTRVLRAAIAACSAPPRVWLNSSTATIYKHNLGPAWDESGEIAGTPEAKDAFSVQVARAWEREFFEARTPGTRRVALRSAMVLGTGANSVLPTLLRLVRLGLGGRMANGQQFVSWIHEQDFCRAIECLLHHEEWTGIVNLAAPNPVTNAEMMATLRELCRVPFGLPAARWMLEIGAFVLRTETELMIKSRRVVSSLLSNAGFEFRFPLFRGAVIDLLRQRAQS